MRDAVQEQDVEAAVKARYAADARPFPCAKGTLVRSPRETQGEGYDVTTEAAPIVCLPGGDCC